MNSHTLTSRLGLVSARQAILFKGPFWALTGAGTSGYPKGREKEEGARLIRLLRMKSTAHFTPSRRLSAAATGALLVQTNEI